jgi:hypothetical protein
MSSIPIRRSGASDIIKAWATAAPGHADQLRRGAWYPVLERETDGHVTVEIDRSAVKLRKEEVIVRADRPDQWSIVVRTGVMRPTLSGQKMVNQYAVCPDCAARQEFDGRPETLMCVRCRRAAKVDWSTTY